MASVGTGGSKRAMGDPPIHKHGQPQAWNIVWGFLFIIVLFAVIVLLIAG